MNLSKDVETKILVVKGHKYEVYAVLKSKLSKGDPTTQRVKGRWLVAVKRDGGKPKTYYSTAALYAAYPNLKGKLGGWLT